MALQPGWHGLCVRAQVVCTLTGCCTRNSGCCMCMLKFRHSAHNLLLHSQVATPYSKVPSHSLAAFTTKVSQDCMLRCLGRQRAAACAS